MVEFIYNHMYILIKILYSLYAGTKRAIVIVLIILFGEYAKEAEPKTSLLSIHSKKLPSARLCTSLKSMAHILLGREGYAPYLTKRQLCSYRKNF